ncbi:MAG: hypothetical protein UY48_C0013G0024 [Candidatus Gottesmanbacteria bacterium GW2011_GWB1_49_7]|uniref:Uncharacterized protein n=1 Tax=Candidatus Gottesmanbacteria bacterium GW2011_GWB1_49_7 TaxID=1618448 RepID=A0A0G1VZ44_9BACT|nr:MAG: hypothetical protein UY48_C0013G0024 [Candidatus Gottesmanbacteria bacterium GW2011_GWB1_49_7]
MPKESMIDDVTAAVVGAGIGAIVGQPILGAIIATPLSKYTKKFIQKKYDVLGSINQDRIGEFVVRGDRSANAR